jgi:hypothetical protein
MATVAKDFKIKNGLIVEGATGTINGSNILTEASTNTVTNKSISLTTNTVTGTLAEFNTAVSDANLASLAGSETLTNKSMSGSSNTFTNIPNNALSNSSITINGTAVSLGGTRTLGSDDISEGSTNKYFTDERAQDALGTLISNGTQTNITVTYDDANAALNFNASGGVSSLTGTANEIEVSSSTGAVTVGLPNDITIAGNVTINGTPSAGTHAVTKQYVDDVAQGLHIHEACVAATTGNVDISTALENGDVVDGVTLATGNRVLVKSQTNAAQNGIYVVQASGAALRASDFNEPQEVDGGDFVFVTGGTLYDNTGWVQTSTGVVTIGTDPIVFTQFSGAGTYLAGNGLALAGNTFSIDTAITADLSTAQTLTNKTLTSPTVSGLYLSDNNIIVEGTNDTHETTLTFTDPTADRTITFKDATGTVAFVSDIPTSTDGLSEGSTNLYFTNERAEDAVGGMVTGNTETRISVTYDDGTGKLNFVADDQFASNTTTNLTEGTNLYFTNARAVTALESVVPNFTEIDINAVATQVAATTAVATASQITAYQFAKADYRSAKFLVKGETATHTELSEVLLTLDSSDNVSITEYAIVGTNGNLIDVTADVSGANVRLRVTTNNNSTDVTVVGTLIA